MVEAHDQTTTHHYLMHYPPHPAREDDPHYKDFHAYHERTKATARCAFAVETGDDSECDKAHPLELHHSHVEFSLQNGVDLARLERVYPGISNPDEVGAWVESGDNFEWLCVLPDVPVLMADGSSRPIQDVVPGDLVVTHDGSAQSVTAVSRKRYRGEVLRFGAAALTPTHRVLTHRGWLPAAEIAREVWVHGPDVVRVRCEQQQVSGGVVGPVAIDMVNPFPCQQWAADQFLHDDAMLHLMMGQSVAVHDDADVALAGELTPGAVGLRPRHAVESIQAAGVGAEAPRTSAPVRVAMEGNTALLTRPEMIWQAAMPSRTTLFSGWVHDLSVDHNHSFVAGGVVVHNCAWHHRGHGGRHSAASADYEASKWVKGLIS